LHSGENQLKASLKNKQDLKPQKQNKDTIESSPSVSNKKRRQENKQTNKPKSIQSKINIKERQRTPSLFTKFQKRKEDFNQTSKNKQTNKAQNLQSKNKVRSPLQVAKFSRLKKIQSELKKK